jgi:hypothetical protein
MILSRQSTFMKVICDECLILCPRTINGQSLPEVSNLSRNKYCWPAKTSLEVYSYYSFIFFCILLNTYSPVVNMPREFLLHAVCSLYTIPKDFTIYFFPLFYDNSIIFQSRESTTLRLTDAEIVILKIY